MGKRIVIALGGNALGNTPAEQLALVRQTAKPSTKAAVRIRMRSSLTFSSESFQLSNA